MSCSCSYSLSHLSSPFLKPIAYASTFASSPLRTPLHSLSVKSSIDKNSTSNSKLFTKPSSWVGPDWLTSLARSLTIFKDDDSGIPIASAKLDDFSDLLGGALFLPLFKWMNDYGPVYRLAAGPRNFVVVSDPAIAKHGRRRAVVPSLHKKYLSVIVDRVFGKCAERMVEKLQPKSLDGTAVNMEATFSQLTLEVVGLSVFNYNFDSLNADSPVIDPVYTALKEAEVKALYSGEIVEAEGERIDEEEYVNDTDPSILRFLLASREEVSSVQLRDDLLSMLVAGHETTGSVLTWTVYLLSKDSNSLMKAQEEVDRVLQGRPPSYEDVKNLKFLTRCITESLRLHPHPPVLIRRAQAADTLRGDYKINAGQDIMISVYNIHDSSKVWERAEEFVPERFDLEGPIPNETNTDFSNLSAVGSSHSVEDHANALAVSLLCWNLLLLSPSFSSALTSSWFLIRISEHDHWSNDTYNKRPVHETELEANKIFVCLAFVILEKLSVSDMTKAYFIKSQNFQQLKDTNSSVLNHYWCLRTDWLKMMEDESSECRNHARLGIMELANMISVPMSLNAVVRLKVADAIWDGGSNTPLSASQILTRLLPSGGGDPENLQRILRMLSSYGVFTEHLNGSKRNYSLTDVGKTLVTDSEGLSYAPYVLQHHQDALMRAWPLVHDAVLDPSTEPFVKANGEPAYGYYGKKPEMNGLMQKAMSVGSAWLRRVPLWAQNLADLAPDVCPHQMNDDLSLEYEDFYNDYNGFFYRWQWVLTTWTDDECKLIMQNCNKALPEGGKLIACEPVLPKETDDSHRTRALLEGDIFVMTVYRAKGKHRTEEEFRRLGLSSGFPNFRAVYIDYFYTVLEFQK
ncbi:hypothetical protein FEM48_Zijuj12G0049500 [Ziziphus jujuba var. spinosa]|uniref:Uncharacterized protein n=1 Tax=Ziziphus jujuba var. spinosa TaxID=714518 RepID=A0A978UBA9_ZIZJJ|nr:hypothetical protein FEM48_Zijuj12G0049500 [Ziziphus jujuba var. spinosa]